MRRRREGFTLIEISISVFILLILLTLAVPSLRGVLKDRRLRRSLDDLNRIVRVAQERSVQERRPYMIEWEKNRLVLQPQALAKDESATPTATLKLQAGDAYRLTLPAALEKNPPPEWTFWPSGTCEPAIVSFKGVDGTWTAKYSALTAHPEITQYVTQ
ncbi:MAG: pilus assembly FimT family protein [Chthoniobacterales bacterium]